MNLNPEIQVVVKQKNEITQITHLESSCLGKDFTLAGTYWAFGFI